MPVLGENAANRIDMTGAKLSEISAALRASRHEAEVAAMLERIRLERIELRFEHIATQVSSLSKRFGKNEPEIAITSNDIRLDPEPYLRFWAACAHVVRNVVDHGFEHVDERVRAGKPPRNRLELSARATASDVEITMRDHGRWINWPKIAPRAWAAGMPSATRADLVHALLSPEISSSNAVTEHSGRRVGMAEVDAAWRALSGRIEIESELGKGCSFKFTLPIHTSETGSVPPRLASTPVSQAPFRFTPPPPN